MSLLEKIEAAKIYSAYKDLPLFIMESLNSKFELRPYQEAAFRNFITYYETGSLRQSPMHTLFHMATGSGKTLIMAGLIVYLYKKGYRNFLFFVDREHIINKTRENFFEQASKKYLFAETIIIDGEHIKINEVDNFHSSGGNDINISFTTTAGLHYDMMIVRENRTTLEDLKEYKIVMIADEAHHLSAETKQGNLDKKELESKSNWENTVQSILKANNENILLEFTATCDLQNINIKKKYNDKIIFDYPLREFHKDKYSKQIESIRTDISVDDRVVLALMFSQYRLKLFENDLRQSIKPVILFKHDRIASSINYMQVTFRNLIKNLTAKQLEDLADKVQLPGVAEMKKYFQDNNITWQLLAQELKEDFAEEKCLCTNESNNQKEKNIVAGQQLLLNSLEEKTNPYRAIFSVEKLNEGWDVLNLFDIVRLYDTRQSGGKSISPVTMAEAQLIGRGARYCPFSLDDQDKYKRKYDDTDTILKTCEELYYHCQNESRYIGELKTALAELGIIMRGDSKKCNYILKDSFKETLLYKDGLVFVNEKTAKNIENNGIPDNIRNERFREKIYTGSSATDILLGDAETESKVKTELHETSIGQIAKEINYSLLNRAIRRNKAFQFDALKTRYPALKSIKEFVTSGKYLGGIKIAIESPEKELSMQSYYSALSSALARIAGLLPEDTGYEGTKDFKPYKISDVIKDKTIEITDPRAFKPDWSGQGISQNAQVVGDERIDLSKEDWFVFNDNFGTSEEKAFVKYFSTFVDKLKKEYAKVFLVRNERQLALYSFDGGERFEPDYLLFLQKENSSGYDQYQIFIEPKGDLLIADDKWKEDFLLQIEKRGTPQKTFVDDNNYHIRGFPFYNKTSRVKEFTDALERFLPAHTGK